ncbi:MAG: HEAT repeat domain-containing protein [Chloroflexota bacterium]
MAYVLLGILIAWLATAALMGREYPKRVQQALKQRHLNHEALTRPDRTSLDMLQQGLTSPHVGVVVYSLDLLEAAAPETLPANLPALLDHPEREVRLDTLRRIERLGLAAAAPIIQARLKAEGSRAVQGASVRALASLGDADAFEAIYPYLDQPDLYLRQGALVGLLRSGELEGILAAGEKLNELVKSPRPAERELAAQALGEAGIPSFYRPLLRLLRDETPPVRRAALAAAGKVKQPKLWPAIIESLAPPQTRGAAATALAAGGEAVLPELASAFQQQGQNREVLIRLTRLAGRIGGPKALALLKAQLNLPEAEVRYEILLALSRGGYQASGEERTRFEAGFKTEIEQAAGALARLVDLDEAEPAALLRTALAGLLNRHRDRLFLWLACLFEARAILPAGETLSRINGKVSAEQRAYAIEVLETQLPPTFKTALRPWLDELPPAERLQRLSGLVERPQPRLTQAERLAEIITGPDEWLTPWVKVCALHAVGQLGAVELSGAVIAALAAPQLLLRQTAAWSLARLDAALYRQYAPQLRQDASPQIVETVQAIDVVQTGGKTMLTPVEKVIRLKAVDFLAEAPEEALAQAAAYLEEIEVKAGETIVAKDQASSAMYLIVEGQARLHDGQRQLASLGENEVFGELSILNPTPQTAAVTALSDLRLLRLEQEALRELLEDHSQVAWGVMQRLAQRLQRSGESRAERARADLLGGLKEKLTIQGGQ